MKRKRGQRGGHKKLKIKQTTENNSNNDNNEISSESEPEPVIKPDKKIQPESKPEPISVPISKPQTQAVYSRVRVKIKSPISVPISNSSPISAPISNSPSIPAPISNSSPISVPIAAPISEKTNLGANTAPKLINTFSRKFGGIKIKTNKSVTPGGGTETGMDKEVSVPVQLPVPVPVQVSESNYDEAELNAALGVIKKIMKMEAAAPFNEPVDPVALGIPDYFDVIETPMDFGTICKEIEKGRKCKYQNSQDVYKDVQLIWQNCYKYNNKGDYVIDLMRRVKKNFSKYWGAAGLSTSNHEGSQNEEGSNEKNQRGKLKQQQKKKKRSTMDHKIDCLCAVCVIRRRKSEKDSDSPTINLEEKSPGTSSPNGTDQSMDYNNTEEKKKKEIKIKSQNSNFGKDEIAVCTNNQAASQVLSSESDESEENNENENDDEENNNIINDNNNASSQPEDKGNKIEALKKNEILVENHSVLELCKSVFDDRSRWTGSTALVRRGPGSVRDNNNNPFHSAIASLLKL